MIKNRGLLKNRPCLMIKIAGVSEDIDESDVQDLAVLDTGFSGQVILPRKLKGKIKEELLNSPVLPNKCPRYKGYNESQSTPNLDTYDNIKIGIKNDDNEYEEFIPKYVSFVERENILIGMEILIQIQAKLTVEGKRLCFSLEK